MGKKIQENNLVKGNTKICIPFWLKIVLMMCLVGFVFFGMTAIYKLLLQLITKV